MTTCVTERQHYLLRWTSPLAQCSPNASRATGIRSSSRFCADWTSASQLNSTNTSSSIITGTQTFEGADLAGAAALRYQIHYTADLLIMA